MSELTWARAENLEKNHTGPATDDLLFGWQPYPLADWMRLMIAAKRAVFQLRGRAPKITYFELGAGIGTKVLMAKNAGLGAHGIEVEPRLIAVAESLGADVWLDDARTTGELGGYDITYLCRLLKDDEAERALEDRVLQAAHPGQVVVLARCLTAPDATWKRLDVRADGSAAVQKI